MKKFKLNNTRFFKKTLALALVPVIWGSCATFTGCSSTQQNEESTSITVNNYDVDHLSDSYLLTIRSDSNKLFPMLVTSKFSSLELFNRWIIEDFETNSILSIYKEKMPFTLTDDERKELIKRLENNCLSIFEDKYGDIISKENLLPLLIVKYGQKPEYSIDEIKSACEARFEELSNAEEETICK